MVLELDLLECKFKFTALHRLDIHEKDNHDIQSYYSEF